MNTTRAQKKEEAITRMKLLGFFDEYIEEFKKNGAVFVSEPPMGSLYPVRKEEKAAISAFEKKWDALVYGIVRSYTGIGVMDTYMFVSDYKEEWPYDVPYTDARPGDFYMYTYVENLDDSNLSEFGEVVVRKMPAGGFLRIY